ncbi:MAG TPA: AEC family transporter [Haploplasma sp.]|nr:AEC family transporter [Haploplasma sp.]
MENLLFALNAILPIVLLMVFGYILKKKEFLNEGFVKIANRIVFKIALPVSLFLNIYNIEDISAINWSVVLYSAIIILSLFFISIVLVMLFVKRNDQKGVIIQDFVRSNYAIIGTPLILFMANGNPQASAVGSVVMLAVIPLTNVLAIIGSMMFIKEEGQKKVSVVGILKQIATNPLIIGILSGFVFVLVRQFILPHDALGRPVFTLKTSDYTKFIFTALSQVGSLATPLALIVLGADFEFSEVKSMLKEITIGTMGRVVIAPVLGLGLSIILVKNGIVNFGPNEYPALIALFCAPAAVSSVAMSIEMKNDGRLAAQLVVWTTILSAVSIFVAIFVFKSLGYL